LDDTELLAALAEIARRKLGWDGTLRPEMRLVEYLELDSIRLLTLAMEVEDRFRIRLDEDDEAGLVRVRDLVALIRKKSAPDDARR